MLGKMVDELFGVEHRLLLLAHVSLVFESPLSISSLHGGLIFLLFLFILAFLVV